MYVIERRLREIRIDLCISPRETAYRKSVCVTTCSHQRGKIASIELVADHFDDLQRECGEDAAALLYMLWLYECRTLVTNCIGDGHFQLIDWIK